MSNKYNFPPSSSFRFFSATYARGDNGDSPHRYHDRRNPDGAIEPHHVNADCSRVNQHLAHSLDQLYAEVTRSWLAHKARMASIRNTPSDRIADGRN